MRLRRLGPGDTGALQHFSLGEPSSEWLREVIEIVEGLAGWRDDRGAGPLGREVLVLDDEGEVIAVAAHEAVVEGDRVHDRHRYLMVTAVRMDRRREGLAQLLVESVVADLQRRGVVCVTWLVHPGNHASIAFSRSVFPNAEETYPPDDRPYAAFTIWL